MSDGLYLAAFGYDSSTGQVSWNYEIFVLLMIPYIILIAITFYVLVRVLILVLTWLVFALAFHIAAKWDQTIEQRQRCQIAAIGLKDNVIAWAILRLTKSLSNERVHPGLHFHFTTSLSNKELDMELQKAKATSWTHKEAKQDKSGWDWSDGEPDYVDVGSKGWKKLESLDDGIEADERRTSLIYRFVRLPIS